MNTDRYPIKYLLTRAYDVALFILAVFAEIWAIIESAHDYGNQKQIYLLCALATIIAIYIKHREKTIYTSNPIERSIVSGALRVTGVNIIARIRKICSNTTDVIIVIALVINIPSL